MTRLQTNNTSNLHMNVRIRNKKCGRPKKSKEKLKFNVVDEDDVGPSVKQKKRKINDNGKNGLDGISKKQRIATHRKFKERKAKLKVFSAINFIHTYTNLYKVIHRFIYRYTCTATLFYISLYNF